MKNKIKRLENYYFLIERILEKHQNMLPIYKDEITSLIELKQFYNMINKKSSVEAYIKDIDFLLNSSSKILLKEKIDIISIIIRDNIRSYYKEYREVSKLIIDSRRDLKRLGTFQFKKFMDEVMV